MTQTFQTFLEIGTTTPKGCAVIKLAVPKGVGIFEFEVRRVGYADSILGAKSWQPSEHWFQFQLNNEIPDGQFVPIQLDEITVANLANSNYSLSVRKYGETVAFKGVLIGGLKHIDEQIKNEISIAPYTQSRSEVSVSKNWEDSISPNETILSPETVQSQTKIEIELPELPHIYKKATSKVDAKSKTSAETTKIFTNSFSKIKLFIGILCLVLVGTFFYWNYINNVKNQRDKDRNPLISQSQNTEIPTATMQEANRIINDLTDPKVIFEIGKSWQSAGHHAEAFILLENSASKNYAPAIIEVAQLYDPLYRRNHVYSFPDVDIVKSANWCLAAYKNGVDIKDEAYKLKSFINDSKSLDSSTKTEALAILNQII